MTDCIFCKIVSRDIPTEFLAETENVLAFRDIAPLAKIHLLIIPKNHHQNVTELSRKEPSVMTELIKVATDLAEQHTAGAFKLQFNTGAEAGQSVFHAHAHVISNQAKA